MGRGSSKGSAKSGTSTTVATSATASNGPTQQEVNDFIEDLARGLAGEGIGFGETGLSNGDMQAAVEAYTDMHPELDEETILSAVRDRATQIEASRAVESFEKKIYKQDVEAAMVVTSNGEVITFNGASETQVYGQNEDIKKMNGGIATHNHPNNSVFSPTDVANGIAKGNLKEMRIVTKSGEIHTIKNEGATLEERRAFSANYLNQTMKATNNAHAKQLKGEIVDTRSFIKKHMTNWLSNHAQEYKMRYSTGRV